MVSRKDDRRPGKLLSILGTTQCRSNGTSAKLKGGRGIHSVYSIPSALTNQHKYTGQKRRMARAKKLEPEEPRGRE